MYRRYIDDCLLVWLHGLRRLLDFVDFMNSRHEDIKFTLEHSMQNEEQNVSYLDLSISCDEGRLDWELFIKPSHSGVHLAYNTALPSEIKKSVAVEQFRRACRNASTEQGRKRGMQKIEKLLSTNGYPSHVIAAARKQASRPKSRREQNQPEYTSILKLPFVNDRLARDVRKAVHSYSREVRVVFQRGPSLKDMLVSSSFGRPACPKEIYRMKEKKPRGRPVECRACDAGINNGQCMSKDVIYSMFCAVCGEEYIGETERCVRERFAEHYRQARAATPETPWGLHYAKHHSRTANQAIVTPFKNASIIAKEYSYVNRRILEAMVIRERCPRVNRDCGWVLIDHA